MPVERFFIDNPLLEKTTVILERSEAFHLTHVIRLKVGDVVELVNGKNALASACILSIHKLETSLFVEKTLHNPAPKPHLILCVAYPRFARLEVVIEKGTELNVSSFWLFPGDRSEKKALSKNQKERLEHLCIAAMKQCGRLDLPSILTLPSLSAWKKPEGTLFFGDPEEKIASLRPIQPPCFFFSGPGAGFSEKELSFMKNWGAQGISLSKNVLKADTAPIAAAAILAQFAGW